MKICSILNSCVVKSKLFKNGYVVLFIFNFVHGKLSLTCPYMKACWKGECSPAYLLEKQNVLEKISSDLATLSGTGTHGNGVPTSLSRFALRCLWSCFKMAIFWMRSHTVFARTTSLLRLILCFCSCELRWRKTECVLLPCFNELRDIFAVMNFSILALSAVFCSGLITWSAVKLCSAQ